MHVRLQNHAKRDAGHGTHQRTEQDAVASKLNPADSFGDDLGRPGGRAQNDPIAIESPALSLSGRLPKSCAA
jgi:hypothetical protein